VRLTALFASGLLALLLLPPAAPAQEGGVFVDPGSPSGKEYAIPIERARRAAQGAPAPGKVEVGKRSAPAFGEGIRTGGAGPAPHAASRTSSSASVAGGPLQPGAAPRPVAARAATGSDAGSVLAIGGVALAVLLAGGAVGLLARRRSAH
jgi:hypothetical protein